ncbi:hypothetical protein PAPYR_3363 [Paratrimastix pyriformis]|uniref:Uncharacterized protein n=1 Tax=Paratrimastix pyriformis TaxID=342808 RepID=A0ABQ8UMD9_9EUKA|nr:hypothetical protein PAPYR_3363 [Paratrimastix pyriformis]
MALCFEQCKWNTTCSNLCKQIRRITAEECRFQNGRCYRDCDKTISDSCEASCGDVSQDCLDRCHISFDNCLWVCPSRSPSSTQGPESPISSETCNEKCTSSLNYCADGCRSLVKSCTSRCGAPTLQKCPDICQVCGEFLASSEAAPTSCNDPHTQSDLETGYQLCSFGYEICEAQCPSRGDERREGCLLTCQATRRECWKAAVSGGTLDPLSETVLTGTKAGWMDDLWTATTTDCAATALRCELVCTSRHQMCLRVFTPAQAVQPRSCRCERDRQACSTQCGRGMTNCWVAMWKHSSQTCLSQCEVEKQQCGTRCSSRYESCYSTVTTDAKNSLDNDLPCLEQHRRCLLDCDASSVRCAQWCLDTDHSALVGPKLLEALDRVDQEDATASQQPQSGAVCSVRARWLSLVLTPFLGFGFDFGGQCQARCEGDHISCLAHLLSSPGLRVPAPLQQIVTVQIEGLKGLLGAPLAVGALPGTSAPISTPLPAIPRIPTATETAPDSGGSAPSIKTVDLGAGWSPTAVAVTPTSAVPALGSTSPKPATATSPAPGTASSAPASNKPLVSASSPPDPSAVGALADVSSRVVGRLFAFPLQSLPTAAATGFKGLSAAPTYSFLAPLSATLPMVEELSGDQSTTPVSETNLLQGLDACTAQRQDCLLACA